MDKKINATPNKAQKDRFMRRANQLVAKSRKSPQYVRDTILTYMNQLHKATFGTRNRKIQNIRDSNLIVTFMETFPREFKIALIKYETAFGKTVNERKINKFKDFFEMYCEAPTMDTYDDEIRVQQAMEIAYKYGYKDRKNKNKCIIRIDNFPNEDYFINYE